MGTAGFALNAVQVPMVGDEGLYLGGFTTLLATYWLDPWLGAGFAIVAEEVRALAQRSATAAKETATKIEESIGKSEHGAIVSTKVAESLGIIVARARRVDTLVAEIATASQEQNQGIGQINAAVGQMDKVTQGNAEELSAQSHALKQSVAELRLLVGANTDRPPGYPAAAAPALRPAAARRPATIKPSLATAAAGSGDFFKDA